MAQIEGFPRVFHTFAMSGRTKVPSFGSRTKSNEKKRALRTNPTPHSRTFSAKAWLLLPGRGHCISPANQGRIALFLPVCHCRESGITPGFQFEFMSFSSMGHPSTDPRPENKCPNPEISLSTCYSLYIADFFARRLFFCMSLAV